MKFLKPLSLVILISFLSSCKSDKPSTCCDPIALHETNGVWILNEGGFQVGNASLDIISNIDSVYQSNFFKTKNQRALGDVLQSVTLTNNLAYLVVNNSQKIEVVSRNTFESFKTLFGFMSPRYFLPINDSIAYVSDLYADAIAVINYHTGVKKHSIKTPGWTEQMLLTENMVLVCQPESDHILRINTSDHTLKDSVEVAYGATEIKQDADGNTWVLCTGDASKNKKGGLVKLYGNNPAILQLYELNPNYLTKGLAFSPQLDSLYFISADVYKVSTNASALPGTPMITANGKSFYGLAVDENTGDVWIANAKDFIQKGEVLHFSSSGNLKQSFDAGVIPNGFWFEQ